MPVRKIKKSYRAVTGLIASYDGSQFQYESSLERDLLIILHFLSCSTVERFEEQPVKIKFNCGSGPPRTYTLDTLVHFRGGSFLRHCSIDKPWLIETKYKRELRLEWTDLRPRFRAATRFAMQSGFYFHLLTEQHIRTELLRTARFLRPFRRVPYEPNLARAILDCVNKMDAPTPHKVLSQLAGADETARLTLLPHIWRLLAMGELAMNLDHALTPRTPLWVVRPEVR
jgi:hypothetical protein